MAVSSDIVKIYNNICTLPVMKTTYNNYMKNIKPLFYLLLLFVFSACSNNELGYNEKTTSLFLDEMKQIDDVQTTFADSNLVLHADAGELISLNIKAENTENNAQQDIQNMNELKPSAAATEFNQGVVTYFTKIKNYGTTAKNLLSAGTDKKRAFYLQLMKQYQDLNQMPDQILEIQKQYLNKVGLKAKQ